MKKELYTTGIALLIGFGGTTAQINDPGMEINGVKWAIRNVDNPGNFAATPEDAGQVYQWNRNTAWNVTEATVTEWDSSTPTGTEWESANDPSPEGWRIPTYEEILSLLDENKVDKDWDDTKKGYTFTDKTSANSIFLPATGYRSIDGKLNETNVSGLYWSSTQRDGNLAYNLTFGNGYASWSVSLRATGYALRPVAEQTATITSVTTVLTDAKVSIAGYYSITGAKMSKEPARGLYIVQYNNGTVEKRMK